MNMKCDLCGKEYEIGHKPLDKPWIDIVYTPYDKQRNAILEDQKRHLFLCDECDAWLISKVEEHEQK